MACAHGPLAAQCGLPLTTLRHCHAVHVDLRESISLCLVAELSCLVGFGFFGLGGGEVLKMLIILGLQNFASNAANGAIGI